MQHNDDGIGYARRMCFAFAKELMPRLNEHDISEADYWDYVKADFGVDSRSELTALQWIKISARLHSAKRHKVLFDELCEKVKTHKLYKGLADAESEAA